MKRWLSVGFCSFCLILPPTTAQPLQPPSEALQILPAVQLVFPTQRAYNYQLLQSTNLTVWELVEEIHGADGEYRRFRAATPSRTFYRMEVWPALPRLPDVFSPATKLLILLTNSNPRILAFNANGRYTLTGGPVDEHGTYSDTTRNMNTFQLHLTPDLPGSTFVAGVVRLNFLGGNSGKITISNSAIHSGTFGYFDNTPPPNWNNLTGLTLYLSSNFYPFFRFTSPIDAGGGNDLGNYKYEAGILKISLMDSGYDISFDATGAQITTVFYPMPPLPPISSLYYFGPTAPSP